MDIYISNATPASFHLGTKDLSGRAQTVVDVPRAPLLSYIPFYAEKGPTEEVVVDGAAFNVLFGSKTLDPMEPYYNHASVFLQGILQDAGTVIAKRIVPEEANKLAALRLSIEYYETEIEIAERDSQGRFKLGQGGKIVTTGVKAPGVHYRFVVSPIPYVEQQINRKTVSIFQFGKGAEQDVVGYVGPNGEKAKRVPLLDFAVSSPGAWGNLVGVSVWAPTTEDAAPLNINAYNDTHSYPFRISVKAKKTPTSNGTVVTSLNGARELDFTLNPSARSKAGLAYGIGETFIKNYNNLKPEVATTPPTIGHFDKLHVYQRNIDALLEKFITKETDTGLFGDFSGYDVSRRATEKYLFNLFGATYTDGAPYQTFRYEKGDESTLAAGEKIALMIESEMLSASGGLDGEMSNLAFEKAVDAILDEFADVNSKYQDSTTFNDSTFWDTGYSLEFKRSIGRYLSQRKDRWVGVTTHSWEDVNIPTPLEENARLTSIVAQLKNFPDSALFGTPCYRAVVVKGSGLFLDSVSTYNKRVPVLYELARMTTKYWGNTSGRAAIRYDFSEGDNNYVKYLTDVSNPWVPYQVRNRAWASGGMWVERSESGKLYFSGIRTIYEDESSTLMNYRIMLYHVELNKIGAELQRRFSGKDWDELRLKQEAEAWFYSQVKDNKFGGKIDVEGELYLTEIDKNKSWAWHFVVRVYGDNIKTVQTFYSENYRRSDKPDNFNGITS